MFYFSHTDLIQGSSFLVCDALLTATHFSLALTASSLRKVMIYYLGIELLVALVFIPWKSNGFSYLEVLINKNLKPFIYSGFVQISDTYLAV